MGKESSNFCYLQVTNLKPGTERTSILYRYLNLPELAMPAAVLAKTSQLLLESNSQPLSLAQLERKGTGEMLPKANREDSSFPKYAYELVTPEEPIGP